MSAVSKREVLAESVRSGWTQTRNLVDEFPEAAGEGSQPMAAVAVAPVPVQGVTGQPESVIVTMGAEYPLPATSNGDGSNDTIGHCRA